MLFVQKYVTILSENYFKGIKKMKILQFWTKYRTKILLYPILLILVSLSVFNYTNKYNKMSRSYINTENASLTVKAVSQPIYEDGKYKFSSVITEADNPSLKDLRVNVYAEGKKGINFYPGDRISLEGEIETAGIASNDGGFNKAMYFMSENVHASIYSSSEFSVEKSKSSYVERLIGKFRGKFMESCDRYFPERYAGLIKALVSGETAFIQKADSDVLKESGIYHIIAISGMHLNIFIIFVAFIVNRLRLKRLLKSVVLAVGSIFISLFVLLFTEFGLSIVRAFVMLVISLGSGIFFRRYRPKTALFLSTVIILILIPRSYYSVGYQLSVLSTYAVLLSIDVIAIMHRKRQIRTISQTAWVGSLVISALCFVTNMPVMISSFGFISMYAWFANLLVLPVATPCLVLGVLFAVVSVAGISPLATIIAYPLQLCMQFMIKSAKVSVSMPYSVVNIYPMYIPYIVMLSAFICIAGYLIFKRRARLIVVAGLILTMGMSTLYNYRMLYPPDAKIVFADVGQGDCSFIRLPGGEAVMVDFGSTYMNPYLADEIERTLVKNNIARLDTVFLTHFHTDHISGIISLAKEGLIEKIYMPRYYDKTDETNIKNIEKLTRIAKKEDTDIYYAECGTEINISGAKFTILHPSESLGNEDNDMSAVIKFSYGEVDVLFTGDLSARGCEYILEKDIECEILKIPHHGSKNARTKELAQKTGAEYAVISCGRNNIYGHPHKDTMKALRSCGVEILRTDTDGAISIEFDKNGIKTVKNAL